MRIVRTQLARVRVAPWVALLPMLLTVLVGYVGTTLWSLRMSVSSARTFPSYDFVGLAQYVRLFENERWILSLQNLAVYGTLFIAACMVLGFLLAVVIDQKGRGEGLLRTSFLYPYAMSFVATGLVWQWVLNPSDGIQRTLRQLGWTDFTFEWIIDQDMVIYTILIAAVWQASGLVMAMLLAALRGIDDDIWKATRIDGIPAWRVYLSIVLPMLGSTVVTVFVLLATGVVKVFDSVVAMTQGGPGIASDVPAKFIMDHLFGRANLALASAGSMVLLLMVIVVLVPLVVINKRGRAAKEAG